MVRSTHRSFLLAVAVALLAAPTARAAGPAITRVALVNADSGQAISTFSSGTTLDLATLPTRRLSLQAFPAAGGRSVAFDYDGRRFRVENASPFAFAGDDSHGHFTAWTPSTGQHTVKVTAYTGANATGTAGAASSYAFTVKDSGAAGGGGGTKAWPTSWSPGASSSQPRFESAATLVGGKAYAFGGFKDSGFHVTRSYAVYDPATNAWRNLGTLPAGMAETHLGLATDARYVYFAGGFGGDLHAGQKPSQWISNLVWRYDTQTNAFTQIATLPAARGAGSLTLVGRVLHYFGGNPADRVTNLGTHWAYNLDTRVWSTLPSMPDPKDHFSAIVVGSRIYALGGEHGHDQVHQQSNRADVYDTATNRWTQLANLPLRKSHDEGGTFVSDGRIVMAGGQTDNFAPTSQVQAYSPATNTWTVLGALPAARQGAIVQRVGTRIVLALGGIATNQPQSGTFLGSL